MRARPRGEATLPASQRSTISWSSSPTSTARARPRPTSCSRKAILRMGVPVSPRNIFPSNIQGLPTWYEVRVTEAGHLGRRGGVDLMVAMNPQTWDADLGRDRARRLPVLRQLQAAAAVEVPRRRARDRRAADRDRATPPTAIRASASCSRTSSTSARCRRCSDIEPDGDRAADRRAVQGQGQAARLQHRGAADGPAITAASTSTHPIGLRVAARRRGRRPHLHRRQQRRRAGLRVRRRHRLRLVPDHAVLLAAPKPSSRTARSCASTRTPARTRYAIVQAEDELASIGMVVGAGWNGARAFTATSGPGISLMTEFIGLAYFAEIPVTIINVQRGGPSTGMPTRTQQADMLSLRLRLAWRHQARAAVPRGPARVLRLRRRGARSRRPPADAGVRHDRPRHRHEPAPVRAVRLGRRATLRPRQGHDAPKSSRPAATSAAISTSTATASRSARCPGTHPTRGAYFTRGTTKDAYARYSEAGPDYVYNMKRLLRKFDTAQATWCPQPVLRGGRQRDAATA